MEYDKNTSPLYEYIKGGRKLTIPKGQVVLSLNDENKLGLIESGYVKRYFITNEGNKSVQLLYGPDDVFPLTQLYKKIFNKRIYKGIVEYYYETMTDLVMYIVNIDELNEELEKNPILYKDVLYAAGVRLDNYIHRMEDIALHASSWRIAHQLVYLANNFGVHSENSSTIQIKLSHQNLAEILDLSRETVTREMKKLVDRGLIEPGPQIKILDLNGLRAIYNKENVM